MQGPRLQQAGSCNQFALSGLCVSITQPSHAGRQAQHSSSRSQQLAHSSPLCKQAMSACLVTGQSQETKSHPLPASRACDTWTLPGCVPMPAKMKSPTPPSMKECLPKPKSFSGRMTLLRKVSFASLGPWGRAAPAQQHLSEQAVLQQEVWADLNTRRAAKTGQCYFELAVRCSSGTLLALSATLQAVGSAAGFCSMEGGPAAAAGHKIAHSKTRV